MRDHDDNLSAVQSFRSGTRETSLIQDTSSEHSNSKSQDRVHSKGVKGCEFRECCIGATQCGSRFLFTEHCSDNREAAQAGRFFLRRQATTSTIANSGAGTETGRSSSVRKSFSDSRVLDPEDRDAAVRRRYHRGRQVRRQAREGALRRSEMARKEAKKRHAQRCRKAMQREQIYC